MGQENTTQKSGEGPVQESEKEKLRRKIAADLAVVERLLARPLLPPVPAGLLDPFKSQEAPPPEAAPPEPAEPEEPDPVETVQETVCAIQEGTVDVQTLSARRRQECVSYLTVEGFSAGSIAQVLHLSERTVMRDRRAWRKREMMQPIKKELGERMAEIEAMTRGSVERMLRMAKDPGMPAYVRLWAEEAALRVSRQCVETTRRMWR